MFRVFVPDGGDHKGTSNCQHDGCEGRTREGKPYCSEHIEDSPYIQEVLQKLEIARYEELLLERGETLSEDSFHVHEALLLLRMGNYTTKGFSRKLDISHQAADRLIRLLNEWDFADMKENSRGELTILGRRPQDLLIDVDDTDDSQ